jgi:hypothetical protein
VRCVLRYLGDAQGWVQLKVQFPLHKTVTAWSELQRAVVCTAVPPGDRAPLLRVPGSVSPAPRANMLRYLGNRCFGPPDSWGPQRRGTGVWTGAPRYGATPATPTVTRRGHVTWPSGARGRALPGNTHHGDTRVPWSRHSAATRARRSVHWNRKPSQPLHYCAQPSAGTAVSCYNTFLVL